MRVGLPGRVEEDRDQRSIEFHGQLASAHDGGDLLTKEVDLIESIDGERLPLSVKKSDQTRRTRGDRNFTLGQNDSDGLHEMAKSVKHCENRRHARANWKVTSNLWLGAGDACSQAEHQQWTSVRDEGQVEITTVPLLFSLALSMEHMAAWNRRRSTQKIKENANLITGCMIGGNWREVACNERMK
uniref:Uncharacterized protein n=1 Tax=Pristionchus pacificus TaxID=54126 RepID=A0A2A6CXP4_PRIPA|eukprot:PDM82992.1 hypothetical protein PRIPAC_37385 [Pristionchus pacificus]